MRARFRRDRAQMKEGNPRWLEHTPGLLDVLQHNLWTGDMLQNKKRKYEVHGRIGDACEVPATVRKEPDIVEVAPSSPSAINHLLGNINGVHLFKETGKPVRHTTEPAPDFQHFQVGGLFHPD